MGEARTIRAVEEVAAVADDGLHGIDVVDTIGEMRAARACIANLKTKS